jgi:7-keto-8-aminopelargonate synthetase-like enzyme
MAGLTLIQEDVSLIDTLWKNITFLKSRLLTFMDTIAVESPIVPLIVGSAEDAVNLSMKLYENGILIPAIRPPTVPPGTSRLRISLMATHSEDDINRLIDILQYVGFLTREHVKDVC